jgi:hypothetical protein
VPLRRGPQTNANILETAGRFLAKYIDQKKDIPQATEELERVIVREGGFGCRAKFLQESTALTEYDKRIVKTRNRNCHFATEPNVGRRPSLQTFRNCAQDNLLSSLRALDFVPHSASVARVYSAHKFMHSKLRNCTSDHAVRNSDMGINTCRACSSRLV